jgi:hypothetical protein
MNQDADHLRLLSIFHYVVAGIGALVSCIPMIHLTIGLLMLFAPESFPHGPGHAPCPDVFPRVFGLIFTVVASLVIVVGWTLSICILLAGRFLAGQRHYVFCLVVAAILSMCFPFGTALGVFTIIVLIRPSVKALFEANASVSGRPTP